MGDLMLREDRDGLAVLTLNRPDKMNSLNVALFEELNDHLEALERQIDSVGVVMVRGAGRCFSAGNDLTAIGSPTPRANFQSHVVGRLAALPQPVISAVHGHCYTGALELALAADFIVASENARFCDTHAKFAMTPVWGMSQRLPRRVGRAAAAEMMMSARLVSGSEAVAMGLANRCWPDDIFPDAIFLFAETMVANSWHSLRGVKALMRETDGMSLDEGLAYEVFRSPGLGPDAQDRIAAFSKPKR